MIFKRIGQAVQEGILHVVLKVMAGMVLLGQEQAGLSEEIRHPSIYGMAAVVRNFRDRRQDPDIDKEVSSHRRDGRGLDQDDSQQVRIDGYDEPVDLRATVTVGETGVDVDFSGTSPISSRGINVPLTYTQAYASFGVRCVVGNMVPNHAGSLGVVRVTAPEGSILNAPRPCAVSARHTVGQMLPDVVLGALSQSDYGSNAG